MVKRSVIKFFHIFFIFFFFCVVFLVLLWMTGKHFFHIIYYTFLCVGCHQVRPQPPTTKKYFLIIYSYFLFCVEVITATRSNHKKKFFHIIYYVIFSCHQEQHYHQEQHPHRSPPLEIFSYHFRGGRRSAEHPIKKSFIH